MKFRQRPVVIEAERFDPENSELPFKGSGNPCCYHHRWYISTLQGDMECTPGDWIIRGVNGEFYPCKPDIFEATYEPVSGEEMEERRAER